MEDYLDRAIVYYRVSTQRQGNSGLGIGAQRSAVQRFAEAEGISIIAEHVETESGKGSDALVRRPQLKAALNAARQARCPMIVARLDRLSRDVAFISSLMAQRVPFVVAELGAHPRSCRIGIRAAIRKARELGRILGAACLSESLVGQHALRQSGHNQARCPPDLLTLRNSRPGGRERHREWASDA